MKCFCSDLPYAPPRLLLRMNRKYVIGSWALSRCLPSAIAGRRRITPDLSEPTGYLGEGGSHPALLGLLRVLDFDDSPSPFLSINYRWNNSVLRFFPSGMLPLQEMRVEGFFPPDEVRRAAVGHRTSIND
jgi:hypothetical protein